MASKPARYTCADDAPLPLGVPGRARLYVRKGRQPLSVLYRGSEVVITDFELRIPTRFELSGVATASDCDRLVAGYEDTL